MKRDKYKPYKDQFTPWKKYDCIICPGDASFLFLGAILRLEVFVSGMKAAHKGIKE